MLVCPAVSSLLLPRSDLSLLCCYGSFVWLSLLLWPSSIILPDLAACCLIVSLPFLLVFLFRCALPAQRFRSNRPFSRRIVILSPGIFVPSVWFSVSSCFACSAFPSGPLRCPFPTRVFASSVPLPVSLRSYRPSFPPLSSRFRFRRASSVRSSFAGCLSSCLVSRCLEAS